MALNPYSLCPCGSGKKVKFCCSKDIVADLDRLVRKLAGDQRMACLSLVDQLIERHGVRASLMIIKIMLAGEMEKLDVARQTADQLLKREPDNASAMVELSIVTAMEGEVQEAAGVLQRAIEKCQDRALPYRVRDAFATLGAAFANQGDLIAGQAHLLAHCSVPQEPDRAVIDLLVRIKGSPHTSILLRHSPPILQEADGEEPWKNDFMAAVELARNGSWRASLERLNGLASRAPENPHIRRNIAILHGQLGNPSAATRSWRAYAALSSVSLQDAVEAEALAQLIDDSGPDDTISIQRIAFELSDTSRAMEALLSDKRFVSNKVDPKQFERDNDEPPPTAAFTVSDRPTSEVEGELKLEDCPPILAGVFVFGKQTDRAARIELEVSETWSKSAIEVVHSVLGELVGEQLESEVLFEVSRIADALQWRYRVPDTSELTRVEELTIEHSRQVILEKWPEMENPLLDGKTPRQAAEDQALQIRLLALILNLEQMAASRRMCDDLNSLRESLNLPLISPIDPSSVDKSKFPPVRLYWLDIDKLSQDLLETYLSDALSYGLAATIWKFGNAWLSGGGGGKFDSNDFYRALFRSAVNTTQCLEVIEQARDAALARKESPAVWLIHELDVRIRRREEEKFLELLNHIRRRYGENQEIMSAVGRMLLENGLVDPSAITEDMVGQQLETAAVGTGAASGSGEQQENESGTAENEAKLWTPETAAKSDGGEKPGIWLPGQD